MARIGIASSIILLLCGILILLFSKAAEVATPHAVADQIVEIVEQRSREDVYHAVAELLQQIRSGEYRRFAILGTAVVAFSAVNLFATLKAGRVCKESEPK